MSDTANYDNDAGQSASTPAPADEAFNRGDDVPLEIDAGGDDAGDKSQPPSDLAKRVEDLDKGLKAERGKRRAEAQEAQRLRTEVARLQGFAEAQQRGGGSQATPKAAPDPLVDPIGAIEHMARDIETYKQTEAQRQQHAQQQQRLQSEVAQIGGIMATSEAEFAKDNPAYFKGADFYAKTRMQELAAYMPEPQAKEALAREFMQMIATQHSQGRDPAETIYNLARSRGFNPAGGTNKLDQIAAGQNSAGKLGGVGGSPQNSMTLGALSNLDGEAFDRAFKKFGEAQRKRESGAR